MKQHKRNATAPSQWNCSFSCGTAVNNYKWVIEPTSADSALPPAFRSFAPRWRSVAAWPGQRRFACVAILDIGNAPFEKQKQEGQGKQIQIQPGGQAGFVWLSRRSNCNGSGADSGEIIFPHQEGPL